MSMHDDYKKEIDSFCETNLSISANDIIAAAENKEKSTRVVKLSGRKRIKRTLVILAACVSMFGITAFAAGVAGYGPLASLFKEKLNDEVSANYVEQGYVYNDGRKISVSDYEITFVAVTGDNEHPKCLVDIRFNDDSSIDVPSNIVGTFYTLGKDQYENSRIDLFDDDAWKTQDVYGFDEVTGVRDEDDSRLFHFNVSGTSAWVVEGQEFIMAVRSLRLQYPSEIGWGLSEQLVEGSSRKFWTSDETTWTMEEMLESEFSTTLPEGTFAQALEISFDKTLVVKGQKKLNYNLNLVEMSLYNTFVYFDVDNSKAKLSHDDINNNFAECMANTVIIVDGVEYKPEDNGFYVWLDTENKNGRAGYAYGTITIRGFSYYDANSIVLKIGDQEAVIK